MLKDMEVYFGIISAIFILIYAFMYILQDTYLLINSKTIKTTINKILPALSKLNKPSIMLALLFTIPHIYYLKDNASIFNTGYLLLILLFMSTCTKLSFLNKFKINQYSSIIAYLTTISLAVHIFFR